MYSTLSCVINSWLYVELEHLQTTKKLTKFLSIARLPPIFLDPGIPFPMKSDKNMISLPP